MIEAGETANFELFRDCLSTTLIDKFATEPPKSKRKRKVGRVRKKSGASSPTDIAVENDGSNDAEELSEFINVNMLNYHPIIIANHGLKVHRN